MIHYDTAERTSACCAFHEFGDIPFTGIDLPLAKFDCSETEKDTGFRAQVSFGEGCRRTAAWWRTELGL